MAKRFIWPSSSYGQAVHMAKQFIWPSGSYGQGVPEEKSFIVIVIDCCLPIQQFFSYIMARTS
jgi:hypothetical protein